MGILAQSTGVIDSGPAYFSITPLNIYFRNSSAKVVIGIDV